MIFSKCEMSLFCRHTLMASQKLQLQTSQCEALLTNITGLSMIFWKQIKVVEYISILHFFKCKTVLAKMIKLAKFIYLSSFNNSIEVDRVSMLKRVRRGIVDSVMAERSAWCSEMPQHQ